MNQFERYQAVLARWREQYGDINPADHEEWWAAVALDCYIMNQPGWFDGIEPTQLREG